MRIKYYYRDHSYQLTELSEDQINLNVKYFSNINVPKKMSDIFAIGDVAGAPWLAHKASHEGVIAAEKIASKMNKYDAKKIHPIKKDNIPEMTYNYHLSLKSSHNNTLYRLFDGNLKDEIIR